MKVRSALLWLLALSVVYLSALAWADSEKGLIPTLKSIGAGFLPMAGLTVTSWLLRFARWQWLLHRAGHQPAHGVSLLAYLAGFSFTATPGKVGELARIRYYRPLGVQPPLVVSAFVFERVIDLLCVLLLASASLARGNLIPVAAVFVFSVCGGVVLFAVRPDLLKRLSLGLARRGMGKVSVLLDTLGQGLSGCRRWLTPVDLLISFGAGLAAWLLLALSFGVLAETLDIPLNLSQVIGTYPLAMLVGAASMMPGGVGSTEAVIVLMLVGAGVALPLATIAAIGVRLTTLWLAIAAGFIAMATLEVRLFGAASAREESL